MVEGETMQLTVPVEEYEPSDELSSADAAPSEPLIQSPPPVQESPIDPATEIETAEVEPTDEPPAPAPPQRPPSETMYSEEDDQDPIYMLMLETIGRMTSCYAEDALPPPVAKMKTLIDSRDYESIRSNFNKMWTDLIQYHRDHGIQLQPRVSHNFRTIDTIVRNL
jgi:hypothetical protein